MKRREVKYRVRVQSDPDCLWAEVLDLEGCFATGDTMDELLENLAEAVGLYLSGPNKKIDAKVKSFEPIEAAEQPGEEELVLLVSA